MGESVESEVIPTELIKKELEKQISLLSKLSENKTDLTIADHIAIAHEIAELSCTFFSCERVILSQIQSSRGGRASQDQLLAQP